MITAARLLSAYIYGVYNWIIVTIRYTEPDFASVKVIERRAILVIILRNSDDISHAIFWR